MDNGYLKIVNNTVVPKAMPRLTTGSYNSVQLVFEFPEEWDNYGKRATFSIGGSVTYVQVIDKNVVVPKFTQTGKLEIGCYIYDKSDSEFTMIRSAHPYTCYVSSGSFDENITENVESAERYAISAGEYAEQAAGYKNELDQVVKSLAKKIIEAYDAQSYIDMQNEITEKIRIQLETDTQLAQTIVDELKGIVTAEAELKQSLELGNSLVESIKDVNAIAENNLAELSREGDFVRRFELDKKADMDNLNVSSLRYHYSLNWREMEEFYSISVELVDSSEGNVMYCENVPSEVEFLLILAPASGTGVFYTDLSQPIIFDKDYHYVIIYAIKPSETSTIDLSEFDISQTVNYYTKTQIDKMVKSLSDSIENYGSGGLPNGDEVSY